MFRHSKWKDSIKYISGPISRGDIEENVQRALMVAEFWHRQGFPVIVPHFYYYWEKQYPKPYKDWIHMSGSMLDRLRSGDELIRLPGLSPGADREIEHINIWLDGVDVRIMTPWDCEEVEKTLGESFPYLPVGQDKSVS